MIKLWIAMIVAMIVVGFIGITTAAQGNYDAADKWAWVSGILLVVYWIIKKLKDEDYSSTYYENACGECGGSGKKVKYTVGLGQHGNVPAYTEITCPKCGGKGRI